MVTYFSQKHYCYHLAIKIAECAELQKYITFDSKDKSYGQIKICQTQQI